VTFATLALHKQVRQRLLYSSLLVEAIALPLAARSRSDARLASALL